MPSETSEHETNTSEGGPDDVGRGTGVASEPIELFEESDGKDVFVCPFEGCPERAQHTTGRTYRSAEDAREYIEVHIALDHEDD